MARTPRDLLTPAALHILMALSREDRHGYGIKKAVEEQTAGRMRLGPGTLYEGIHRMESSGWIEEVESEAS
ncbi:MAG: helix-turn-helix transcriptional regulator, partial [Gemmatimonadota bacterium]|nr:helix-turn-helix transcriptional regulator [Gemmatimonadota bacterium]